MGEQEVPVDEARETLERLYDNPDEQIPKLHAPRELSNIE